MARYLSQSMQRARASPPAWQGTRPHSPTTGRCRLRLRHSYLVHDRRAHLHCSFRCPNRIPSPGLALPAAIASRIGSLRRTAGSAAVARCVGRLLERFPDRPRLRLRRSLSENGADEGPKGLRAALESCQDRNRHPVSGLRIPPEWILPQLSPGPDESLRPSRWGNSAASFSR